MIVVHSQADLESIGDAELAIWIDRESIGEVDSDWLKERAAAGSPVAVVGLNDPFFCFCDKLSIWPAFGPLVDDSDALYSGFCVYLHDTSANDMAAAWVEGAAKTPTVEAIEQTTERLLRESH